MNPTFRFVIVGSGNISRTYFRSIANLPEAEVAAIVSRSGKRPEGAPESLPVFPSLGQVSVPFDAVILTTPNGMHGQGAAEAAALGKHVLTEKVLEISLESMDRMIHTCREAGVKLAVTYQRRVSPDNIAIKRLLEQRAFGRVFAADMQVKFYRDEAYFRSGAYRGTRAVDGGGPFVQQASHNADLLCWFFGMPTKVVSMCDRFLHQIEVEDHGVALLRYPDGMIGTFTASTVCKPGFPTQLAIHAEAGSLVMENDQIKLWKMEGVANPAQVQFLVHDGASSAAVADTTGHEGIIRDFVQAIRGNREPLVSGEQGKMASELVLNIYAGNVLSV